jgi:RNA polymerase sigma factor (sigma-70 family)
MHDDAALLREYAENRSEAAFAEVVRRHLNFVYSAALRQVGGDSHLAEDVAQIVFCALARKPAAAANVPVLAGWLYTSTHYAAAKIVRGERRRRAREVQAHAMQEMLNDSVRDAEWARIRPVLDDAVRQLRPDDRDAILLRFFEGEAFARIGDRLGLTENAARMRVERALEKLGEQLRGRGIHSAGAALATVLAGQAVAAAPTSLASAVTQTALLGASGGALGSFLQFMALTKTQVAVAATLLVGGAAFVVQQQQAQSALRKELGRLRTESTALARVANDPTSLGMPDAEAERLQAELAELSRLRAEAAALRQKIAAASAARTNAATLKKSARNSAHPASAEAAPASATDHMPTLKSRVPPVYPFALRQAGISGRVDVTVTVDSAGNVHDARVAHSTHAELESPALESVKQWKFDPGMKGGRAVNARLEIPIIFNVDPAEKEWF